MSAPSQSPRPVESPSHPATSVNLKIFAVELSHWGLSVVGYGSQSTSNLFHKTGRTLDQAKKAALKPMLPRDSRLGRPFSPLGVGGLTAVIGIGGMMFGHNGVVADHSLMQSTDVPEVLSTQSASTAVIADDLMVDSSTL